MGRRDISKPLWIIAIVLVIFLIVVILVLIAPIILGGVTVTTGEVTDHDLKTSVKVTLEGEKDSYSLSMAGPGGTEMDSALIIEAQMADGKQSVWMSLVGEPKIGVAAKPGAYSLVVTASSGNKVYEKTFGPYSGSDLSIINIGTTFTSYKHGGYYIESIPITCRNDGDLPAYVRAVNITIDTIDVVPISIPEEEEVILPGEMTAITVEPYAGLGPFGGGDYSLFFKLKEGFFGGGKTVATCTKVISIP